MRPPPDSAWDFSPVIELLDSDWADAGSPRPLSPLRNPHGTDASVDRPVTESAIKLGSFGKIFEHLGISVDAHLPDATALDYETEGPSNSDDALLSTPDDNADPTDARDSSLEDDLGRSINDFVRGNANTETEDPFFGMTRKQRHKARKQAEKARKNEQLKHQEYARQEMAREELQNRLDRAAQNSAKGNLVPRQVVARSNVGAKVRSTSPVQLAPSTLAQVDPPAVPARLNQQLPSPGTVAQQNRPGMPLGLPSYHRGPASLTVPPPNPTVYNEPYIPALSNPQGEQLTGQRPSALANLNSSLTTQYTTAGAHPTYHHQLANGFVTPVRGPANVITPSSVPAGLPQFSFGVATPGTKPFPNNSKLSTKVAPLPREDRNFEFLKQLIQRFPEDKKWLVSPMRLSNEQLHSAGIHVFVDASNILIGFKDFLRRNREPPFDMSFDCLALLLERRRPVAKRVYAGSTRVAAPVASVEKFTELAGAVGYEKNIYEQVYKVKEQTESQKFFKDVDRMGWAKATQRRSGSGSDSETGATPTTPPALKWVEQGVDESLHLKMCQSIIDVEAPTTMVLATGDGAAAEYSDGFLAHVERALKKGWKVELVSWKQQTSGGYKNRRFREKWGDQFKIIVLDDYVEWMIDA